MGLGRKRRKKKESSGGDDSHRDSDDGSSIKSVESTVCDQDKYNAFRIPNYTRYYPEDGGNFEYIVFLESSDFDTPIGNRDIMSLANSLKRYNKGIKQLQRLIKFKIGVIFERPGLANAALNNRKFLDAHKLKASIPASATEVTGVIKHVPIDMTNKQIYSALTSTKNIISIRRFMRRVKDDHGVINLQPTKTVSITFSCPVLPESVDLNSWRFEVSQYVPPVKQCLRCLRYGHIGKFCKNSERCSICSGPHNFRNCTISPTEACCYHCQGKHIAISSECPVKKEKIRLNKEKLQPKSYIDILNEKAFPSLGKKSLNLSPSDQLISLLDSDSILNMLVESYVKLITLNTTKDTSICTQSIKDVLLETIKQKKVYLSEF
ncbi:uncharacterized protein ACR2FA_009451 [Aphomia sociella]